MGAASCDGPDAFSRMTPHGDSDSARVLEWYSETQIDHMFTGHRQAQIWKFAAVRMFAGGSCRRRASNFQIEVERWLPVRGTSPPFTAARQTFARGTCVRTGYIDAPHHAPRIMHHASWPGPLHMVLAQ